MPPEVWRNQPYSFSSDVWALGCLLYEMASFSVPFEARSMSELRQKVMRGRIPPVPKLYSSDLANMVSMMLDPNQDARPPLHKILEMECVVARRHLLPEHLQSPGGDHHAMGGSLKPNLLETIQVPRNLKLLKDRLPAPQYPDENPDSQPSWENDNEEQRYTGGSVNGPSNAGANHHADHDQRVGGRERGAPVHRR